MTHPRFAQLLELAASSALGRAAKEEALRALENLGEAGEKRVIRLLGEHRLQHLFWDALTRSHREDVLSGPVREFLRSDFELAERDHAAHQWALVTLSDTLSRAGVEIIACKGVVLARDYYPKPGLRRMHDVDLWLIEPDISTCRRELLKLGYKERVEKAAPEAHNFVNEEGIVLDVHTAMRLFQDRRHNLVDLSRPAPGLPYRVFIPEAQIAHLLTHLLGHAAKTGILICWLIDIALVLRAHPTDPKLIKKLLHNDGSWEVLLRLIHTFLDLGWIENGSGLENEARTTRKIHWETLLRQRRLCGWRGARGKLSLAKTLALGRPGRAPIPQVTDYLLQPLDWVFEQNPLAAEYGAMLVPRKD